MFPRVRLACADDDAQGQTLDVYWDFEIDRRILEQESWTDLDAKGFDPPRPRPSWSSGRPKWRSASASCS